MSKLVTPDDIQFIVNLILQRTGFLIKNGHTKAINEWTTTGSTKSIEALASNPSFLKEFLLFTLDTARVDAKMIADTCLQHKLNVESFVSIGCGNGLVEYFLAKYLDPSIIYLIDIEETPGKYHHGISDTGSGYSSLSQTVSFLSSNLSPRTIFVPINPSIQSLPSLRADLILSLISAGFHYPITSYREFILNSLNSPGLLSFDQRLNAGPSFICDFPGFSTHQPCFSHKSFERVVLSR